MSAWKKAENFAVAAVGVWLIHRLVMPGNQTAVLLNAMNTAFSQSIKVAIGEGAIARRDVPRFAEVLGEMTDPMMTELFAGLSDTDLDWAEEMLRDA